MQFPSLWDPSSLQWLSSGRSRGSPAYPLPMVSSPGQHALLHPQWYPCSDYDLGDSPCVLKTHCLMISYVIDVTRSLPCKEGVR